MNIKIIDGGKLPERQHSNDAGMDCYARQSQFIEPGETVKIPLGFAVELPDGLEMQIRGRSGVSLKGIICHLGTVDAGYRGEVSAILTNHTKHAFHVAAGDRIAQAVIASYRVLPIHAVETLSDSIRGSNGFGSTGV